VVDDSLQFVDKPTGQVWDLFSHVQNIFYRLLNVHVVLGFALTFILKPLQVDDQNIREPVDTHGLLGKHMFSTLLAVPSVFTVQLFYSVKFGETVTELQYVVATLQFLPQFCGHTLLVDPLAVCQLVNIYPLRVKPHLEFDR